MDFDYLAFKKELKEKTKLTYLGIINRLNRGDIAGFALYSDESAITISVSCNTFQHLDELISESEDEDREIDRIYYKWTPEEWKYEMINNKEFEVLSNQLRKHAQELINESQFLEHVEKTYNISVEALEELRMEELFKGTKDDFVLMFGISDFSDIPLEISFVKRLNFEKLALEFEKWIVTQDE